MNDTANLRAYAARFIRAGAVMVTAIVVSGCLVRKESVAIAYDAGEHAPWAAKGTARIEGEGFLRRPNGWLARCSGGIVYLVPHTAYFRDYVRIRRSGAFVDNDAATRSAFDKSARKTQCNMNGRFTFEELPAGKWFVALRISYEGSAWQYDSSLVTEVETKPGEAAKVILSNPNGV